MLKMTDQSLFDKRLLIRVDLNVPIEKGKVVSKKRIEAILPTLHAGIEQGARIILLSHLGRPPEEHYDADFSLAPVAVCLSELLNKEVRFVPDINSHIELARGEVALLENVRFLQGEKANSPVLGKKLASLCDIFVMDAFATAHRKEASTYSVAEFAKLACAGPLLLAEIAALEQIMEGPLHPVVAIVAGSKVSTKLSMLKKVLSLVDSLILGGGIANTFLAAQGYAIGKSLYEAALIPEARELLKFANSYNRKILLPSDVVVATEFSPEAQALTKSVDEVASDEIILDTGPQTNEQISQVIKTANTILWNGPLGVFEWDQFGEGTWSLAKSIMNSPGYSVAGGGDTLAAIDKYGIDEYISYISTGGGAFLAFLEGRELPAIAILKNRYKQGKYATN